MENKYKDWLKLGFIGYLLSLPILIWNSSKIGKAISILLLTLITMLFLNFVSDWGLKLYSRFLFMDKLKPVIQKIDNLDKSLEASRGKVNSLESDIKLSLESRISELESKYKSLVIDREEKIEGIEKSIELIKETERQAVKDKIIGIKEQVKLYNKSIDSKEVRKELELVATNLYLLSSEEKDRFMKDLEDIGFQVKVAKQEVNNIIVYSGYTSKHVVSGWANSISSGCVVY